MKETARSINDFFFSFIPIALSEVFQSGKITINKGRVS